MEVRIELQVRGGGGFLFDLFDAQEVGPGTSTQIAQGITATLTSTHLVKGLDVASTFELVCAGLGGVVSLMTLASTVAGWLSRKGPAVDDVVRLTIEEEEIVFDEGEITNAIRRRVELEHRHRDQ